MITCTFENDNKAQLRHLVVHCVVVKENKILLEKRAMHLLEGGKWALPGGFVDRDENAEEAAVRELLEETGWTSEVIALLRLNSRPDRPHEDRQNVALDYVLQPLEHTGEGDDESTDIQWFDLDNLPDTAELAFDHLETIQLYKEYVAGKLQIPVWRAV